MATEDVTSQLLQNLFKPSNDLLKISNVEFFLDKVEAKVEGGLNFDSVLRIIK
ncbi:hypothetical protein MKX03_031934, partial [Papaver bracteatum]